jgi:hypothetical protein
LITVDALVVSEEVLPPDLGAAGVHVVGAAGTSTLSTEYLPRELVPIVNLHTDTRSRSARGHLALACPSGSSSIGVRVWTGAYLTAFQAFAAKLDDTFSLGVVGETTVRPVVYSKTRRKRALDPYTFHVVNATVNTRPKWLRSRGTTP